MLKKVASTLVFGLVVVAILTVGTTQVFAQGAGPQVKYKKETRYDFDDDVVEGELQRPEGDILQVRTGAKYSSLIKLRLDFIPEIVKSAENL